MPNWKTVITAVSIPSTIAVYGNGKNIKLYDGHNTRGTMFTNSGDHTVAVQITNSYNVNVGTAVSSNGGSGGKYAAGLTTSTDGSSGIIAKSNSITRTSLSIKFSIKY